MRELHRECYQKLAAFRRCLAPSAMVSADASNLAELRRGTDPSRAASPTLSKASSLSQVPGTNGTVRLGSERKFSSGTWKIFVILPRALAIDDDFKNLPWLKFRTFLASAN